MIASRRDLEHAAERHDLPSHRPALLEIDLSAISHNASRVKALIGPQTELMAVVKAGGYGLGARWVAAAALLGGASRLGVACVDEGLQLRLDGFTCPILVMGYADPAEYAPALQHGLTLTVHSAAMAKSLDRVATELGMPGSSVPVHLKIDTGLHRYGSMPPDLPGVAAQIKDCTRLRCEALMTHFANADSTDLSFTRTQLERFHEAVGVVRAAGLSVDFLHAANSAATLALPESRLDLVRVGLLLGGHYPSQHLAQGFPLRPAARLTARLGRVAVVPAGESLGYGRTWIAAADTRVGLVPLGYADGYRRAYSNRSEALVGGVRCPIIGRVSMDQLTLDLSGVPDAQEGDEVVLVGTQGNETVTFADLAALGDTITYEILCGLSRRIPRRYYYRGNVVGECDLHGCSEVDSWEGSRR